MITLHTVIRNQTTATGLTALETMPTLRGMKSSGWQDGSLRRTEAAKDM